MIKKIKKNSLYRKFIRYPFLLFYNVALLTWPPRKRGMYDIFEELGVFWSMGFMAVSAIHDRSFYIDVSFAKSCPFKVVAFPA